MVAARDELPAVRPRLTTANPRGKFKPPRARGIPSARGGGGGSRRASKRSAEHEHDNVRSRKTTYSTTRASALPDLNDEAVPKEEIQLTQNAPSE